MPQIESRTQRVHEKDQPPDDAQREPFELDRDRILYSYEFRRLSGVSQVAAAGETHLLHNRLTHSLKVAQIGRRLAQRINRQTVQDDRLRAAVTATGGLDPDVVEAAGMAHDLGHPPFGHIAEDCLDKLLGNYGGFEGNAQTFRIVTKLAVRKGGLRGLDLSYATLNAILKYPKIRTARPATKITKPKVGTKPDWTDRHLFSKAGVYESEKDIFDEVRKAVPAGQRAHRRPESILMDWADDVSYAVHDVEDFFRAGLIPLHDLQRDQSRFQTRTTTKHTGRKGASFNEGTFADCFDYLCKNNIHLLRPFYGEAEDLGALHRFASDRITDYAAAVDVVDYPPYITIDPKMQYEALALMELTWYYVIDRPALASAQAGQRKIIREVFGTLDEWVADDLEHPRLPRRLRDLIEESKRDPGDGRIASRLAAKGVTDYHFKRAVADYIAALTEPQIYDLHARISGERSTSVFGTWL